MRKTLAFGLGLALVITAGALAQVRVDTKDREGRTTKVRKVSAIMGTEVRIRTDAVGKVADFVLNDHGCIDYLIVQDAEEYIAVPWGVVRYEVGARYVTITADVTRDRLRTMRFRSGAWPDFRSERWTRDATTVWGERALRREGVRRDDTRRDDIRRDDIRKDSAPRKDDTRRDDRRRVDPPKDSKRPVPPERPDRPVPPERPDRPVPPERPDRP